MRAEAHEDLLLLIWIQFDFDWFDFEVILEHFLLHGERELHLIQAGVFHAEQLILDIADSDCPEVQHHVIVVVWEFQFHRDIECFRFEHDVLRLLLNAKPFGVFDFQLNCLREFHLLDRFEVHVDYRILRWLQFSFRVHQ